MINIVDFKTDNADDLVLTGDLEAETNDSVSTIKTAERRVTARYDDFLLSQCGAGLEQFMLKRITDHTKYLIRAELKEVLTKDKLFFPNEFSTSFLDPDDEGRLPTIIRFSAPSLNFAYTFSTLVNLQDQRSYN